MMPVTPAPTESNTVTVGLESRHPAAPRFADEERGSSTARPRASRARPVDPRRHTPIASRDRVAKLFQQIVFQTRSVWDGAGMLIEYGVWGSRLVLAGAFGLSIAEARRILSGDETMSIHVMGRIRKTAQSYNPGWSFHPDPDTITFFTMAIEVCDSSIVYTEDHLDEACGAFLPGCFWCPWSSRLTREVTASVSA